MFDKTKKFVKEHKTEIIAGTVLVAGGAFIGYKFNKMNKEIKMLNNISKVDEIEKINTTIDCVKSSLVNKGIDISDNTIRIDRLYDIGHRSLNRERERIMFAIDEIKEWLENIDPSIKVNKFENIPRKEKMLKELEIQLADINFDVEDIEKIMEDIWN